MSELPSGPAVLLADDEVLVRDLVQEPLEEAGFRVVTAGTGREALQALAGDGDLRALVTDINFGPAPSGWEVATAAREANPTIAIVYMTGDSAHEWSAHGVPGSVVIAKPLAPTHIVVALFNLLNQAHPRPRPQAELVIWTARPRMSVLVADGRDVCLSQARRRRSTRGARLQQSQRRGVYSASTRQSFRLVCELAQRSEHWKRTVELVDDAFRLVAHCHLPMKLPGQSS